MTKESNNNVKNILVVRLGKIGDLITASFVFDVLKKNFPTCTITLITLKSNLDVIKYNRNVDKTVFVNKNIFSLFHILKLRHIHFDKIFELNDDPSTTSRMILKLMRGKEIFGFAFNKTKEYLTTSVVQPPKTETHIIERTAYLLEKAGIYCGSDDKKPILYLGDQEKSDISNHLNNISRNRQLLSMNFSAGAPIRYWKTEYWCELIRLIISRFPSIKIILLSHPKDKVLRERISSNFESDSIIIPKDFSFQHHASYIYFSDMLISPDTSAIHIASAFRKPVIGLYPNYEWAFVSWQPYGTPHRSIKSSAENISEIQPQEVFNAYLELSQEIKLFN